MATVERIAFIMAKTLYLMRGLPGCGKSHTAKKIAGADGVVCEVDAWFEDSEGVFRYKKQDVEFARGSARARARAAMRDNVCAIVADRGCGDGKESRRYVKLAKKYGYKIVYQEPDSPHWRAIKIQLENETPDWNELRRWSDVLATLNRHNVSSENIYKRMQRWKPTSELT